MFDDVMNHLKYQCLKDWIFSFILGGKQRVDITGGCRALQFRKIRVVKAALFWLRLLILILFTLGVLCFVLGLCFLSFFHIHLLSYF